jgi:hypothetical protein
MAVRTRVYTAVCTHSQYTRSASTAANIPGIRIPTKFEYPLTRSYSQGGL